MLNENALKMVGPTFEEVGVKTKGNVSMDSDAVATAVVSVAYTVAIIGSAISFSHK